MMVILGLVIGWNAGVSSLLAGGETIVMDVHFGFLYAGQLELRCHGVDTVGGAPAYRFSLFAKTAGSFGWVYKVADWIYAWMDTSRKATLRYEKDLQEGGKRFQRLADYISEGGYVVYREPGKDPDTVRGVPEGALDPLSVFYYVRLVDKLEVGDTLELPYHVDRRSSVLPVVVLRRDTLQIQGVRMPTLVLQPRFEGKNILNTSGDMFVWVTNDGWRIPVQITAKFYFGTLKGRLKDYIPGDNSSLE